LKDWEKTESLILLNLKYDLTPHEYITMIICEHGKVPAISVPVVIRELTKELEESSGV
jgi:translation initiation factor eIF-2B subunit delta